MSASSAHVVKEPLRCPNCGSTDWEWTWKRKPWGKPEIECHACPYVGIMYVRAT